MKRVFARSGLAVVFCGLALLGVPGAQAQCDRMDGPIVTAAKKALEKRDVTPVLRWVGKGDEPQVKTLFAKVLVARAKGAEAREVADLCFFETVVRLHQQRVKEPYTGLSADPPEPVVAAAEKAVETGSADAVIKALTAGAADRLRKELMTAVEKKKLADKSVEAGRDFVKAYLDFIYSVEDIQAAITGEPSAEDTDSDDPEEDFDGEGLYV